jgi:hypothetical protein
VRSELVHLSSGGPEVDGAVMTCEIGKTAKKGYPTKDTPISVTFLVHPLHVVLDLRSQPTGADAIDR